MTEQQPTDNDLGERFFQQAMELWVSPALAKRQAAGEIEIGQRIAVIQVLFFPDERPIEVRINEEVKCELVLPTPSLIPGQLAREEELTDVAEVHLLAEDRDCGHVTIF